MNHYLFKYAIEKSRELFTDKRITSVGIHSASLFSIAFQHSEHYLFVDLSPQNSFVMPFKYSLTKKERNDLPFFHFLKKNLPGLKVVDIIQKGSERIVTFVLEDIRGSIINRYKLILEIIDRNTNAIFTDEENTILQAFKYTESERAILPKRKYTQTPPNMPDLLESDLQLLINRFKHGEDILGFSSQLRRIVKDESEFANLIQRIRETFEKKEFSLYLYPKNSVFPFYFQKAIREVDEHFLFDMFIVKPRQREIENRKNNIKKTLKKRLNSLRRRLFKVEDELKRAKDFDIYRIYAENLMANPKLDISYLNSVEINDIYTGKPIIIPLNQKLSLFENAQYYFKRYKKAKKSVELVEKRIEQTKKEMQFVEQLLFDIENAYSDEEIDDIVNILIQERIIKSTQKVRNIKNYLPFEKIKIYEFEAYVGKNARGNDIVTLKLSSKNDLWFHAKNRPSSHLVLKLPAKLKNVDNSVIIKAAKEVAKRSKSQCREKVEVDYTYIKNVKKPKGLKPGMVLYKNFKTVIVENGECS